MASKSTPAAFDHHFVQSPAMMSEGLLPHVSHGVESPPSLAVLEKKLASQRAELEQLSRDNRILVSSHMRLVNDVTSSRIEADKLREHIKNIQSDGDIELRIILDRQARMEADIRSGDIVRKELQEAHNEAQSLLTAKMELTAKIEQATKELEKASVDIKRIPRMHVQLDSLRQEHLRLRKTFEYEKGLNTEKVEQMKKLESNMVVLAEEVERLRTTLSDAERRATENSYYAENLSEQHLQPVGWAVNGLHHQTIAPDSSEGAPEGKVADNPTSGASSDMSYGDV